MKIDRLTTRTAEIPLGAARGGSGATAVQVLHVTVRDTDGAAGTGFTYSLSGGVRAARAIIDDVFASVVADADPLEWDRIWHELWQRVHRPGQGAGLAALSALDIAVWDLRANTAQLPLFRMLGAHRHEVPVYGSGRATHQMSDAELVEGAQAYVAEGYRAVKLRAGALGIGHDLARISAVRDAVGTDIEIMIDCNERLDLAAAQRLAHRLDDLAISWLEEPLIADDVAGHRLLAARSPVPIAVGEHLQGRHQVKQYLDHDAAAVIMPDAPLAGGFTECQRIATLAEVSSVAVSPHFLPELHVHLAAASRTATWVEHFPLIDGVLLETLVQRDGTVAPPERSGHGMLWDYQALDKYSIN